jgi:hypothetical protein
MENSSSDNETASTHINTNSFATASNQEANADLNKLKKTEEESPTSSQSTQPAQISLPGADVKFVLNQSFNSTGSSLNSSEDIVKLFTNGSNDLSSSSSASTHSNSSKNDLPSQTNPVERLVF